MSTIGIEGTERCAALAQAGRRRFVDAPVSGTKAPAEQGELAVLASGPEEARDRCQPYSTPWAGDDLAGDAGAGHADEAGGNSWLLSQVEGLAETVAFAEGIGIDPALFLETISGSASTPLRPDEGQDDDRAQLRPLIQARAAAKDARLV